MRAFLFASAAAIAALLFGTHGVPWLEKTRLQDGKSTILSPCRLALLGPRVVDGDTIECHGHLLRLQKYDTPEFYRPLCNAERARAIEACRMLDALIEEAGRRGAVPRVAGFSGGFGRWEFDLTVGGRSVGEALKDEGLAIGEAKDGKERLDRRLAAWCGGKAEDVEKRERDTSCLAPD
ncbi:MAG: hypothetical protein H6923_00320 [Alphaproteobacteria bacterium]|nr:hypothetical protein [Alphaproteobacteria bacterium]